MSLPTKTNFLFFYGQLPPYTPPYNFSSAVVYQRSGAGNRHFCNMLAKIEDHINMILNLFFTGSAIQSCYGRLKSTGGRSKNGIFRVYTVKNDKNRHENDVICASYRDSRYQNYAFLNTVDE